MFNKKQKLIDKNFILLYLCQIPNPFPIIFFMSKGMIAEPLDAGKQIKSYTEKIEKHEFRLRGKLQCPSHIPQLFPCGF